MRHGSLFSGIGGFDLAAEWMGWENVFHCEWNKFGQQVLNYYWPNAISYHDIKKTDFTIHRGTIDILTGGFPCQPYSLAGKRKGKEDDRHLWPEMLRAIREIQPTSVVGENVFGIVNWDGGLVFNEVQADLEAEGYEVQPYVLPACAVNAPHRRDRVWFVAYRKSAGAGGLRNESSTERPRCSDELSGISSRVSCDEWSAADTDSAGISRQSVNSRASETIRQGRESIEKIGYFGYIATWSTFPTQSSICFGNDGLSSRLDGITFPKWRNESIKAAGNAIVPQVALQIFKAIEQYQKNIQ